MRALIALVRMIRDLLSPPGRRIPLDYRRKKGDVFLHHGIMYKVISEPYKENGVWMHPCKYHRYKVSPARVIKPGGKP